MRFLVGLPLLKEHNMAGLGKSPKCYTGTNFAAWLMEHY